MLTTRRVLAVVLLAGTAARAEGPVASRKTLTLEGARSAVAAALAEAKKTNATGVVAVVDDGGNLMALERLDGTFAAGANISIGKARTAALFKRPTRFFEEVVAKGRTAMVAVNDFTPLQGGVPIVVEGQVVGGIGVSGAASAQQDEELALAGANALATRAAPVAFFDHGKVAAAFSKGAPLIEVDGYKVHASRREAPGQAEVHVQDTDIIHVLKGSATFITGGTVVQGKTVAPAEIRGSSIEGGETRRLVENDVVIVPKGVAHWFQQVDGPLTYYVVKVR
jgi:uncharacterized protein GlcG (DUF336 family)